MDNWKPYTAIVVVIGAMFCLDILFRRDWVWLIRTTNLVMMLALAWSLRPQFALIPGIFSVPGDLLLLSESPTSLDFLTWAIFIGVPYGVAILRENENSADSSAGSSPSSRDRSSSESSTSRLSSQPVSLGDQSFERMQTLIKIHLKRARSEFECKTLLLYRVENNTAKLSFALDPADEVNRELQFQADHGQGIGWVLRHGETLTQRGRQVDWRNLQYRLRPGDLEQVSIVPIHLNSTLIGVLVLEWTEEPRKDEQWESLVRPLKHLLALRTEIQQLRKNQDVFELLKRLQKLNPLEENRFDSMIHRSLEIVEEFIPVGDGHAEFFSYTDEHDSSGVIHQGRRALYEECMNRIRETGEILRINDLKKHPLGGRIRKRFSSGKVRSFLGGAVRQDETLIGMICLDHPESGYFTSSDAAILRMLLEHLSQVLRIGQERKHMQARVRDYRAIIEPLQTIDTRGDRDVLDVADQIAEKLHRVLPTVGVGFYQYADGDYQRTVYHGNGSPTEYLEADHTMIRRLRNAETKTSILSFPDLKRFEHYEPPLAAEALVVAPVATKERFVGFFTLFVNQTEKLDDALFEEFDSLLPLIIALIRLVEERESIREQARREPVSELLAYSEWKRQLSDVVEAGQEENLIMWYIRVPGFETIAVERGRDRAHNWVESISNVLRQQLNQSRITRSYATTFVGFGFGEVGQMEDRLRQVIETLSSWSFPAGSWPGPPESGYKRFSPPLPSVRKLVEAPFSAGRSKREPASAPED